MPPDAPVTSTARPASSIGGIIAAILGPSHPGVAQSVQSAGLSRRRSRVRVPWLASDSRAESGLGPLSARGPLVAQTSSAGASAPPLLSLVPQPAAQHGDADTQS